MIDNLDELNIALGSVHKLMDADRKADLNLVIDEYKKNTKGGRMPDYELTIQFSTKLGFVSVDNGIVQLHETAESYIGLNITSPHDLTQKQKSYLVRTCFLGGGLKSETRKCLKCFVEAKGTFIWSAVDHTPLGEYYWIAEHLYQVGVLRRTTKRTTSGDEVNGYQVGKKYVETVATFLSQLKGLSEEKLMEILKEKKELGNYAEQIITKYEETRLRNAGHIVESLSVDYIGKHKVNAGFDIQSFNGKSSNMNFDRFIEVKGSKSPKLRFIWSTNEIKIAKELGDSYWIYFQGGIDIQKKLVKNAPLLYQNPYKLFIEDQLYPMESNGYVVQANVSGELIK